MFWLTGLCADKMEIDSKLKVTSPAFGMAPSTENCIQCAIFSVREEQTPEQLYESGKCLILFNKTYKELTRNGCEILKIHVTIN